MEANARDLIYLDTKKYVTLKNLRGFYWCALLCHIAMLRMGSEAMRMEGLNWRTAFPFISCLIWSVCYWIFVLKVGSWKTKKTFQLRFLVNGISEVLISSLFWIFYVSMSLFGDNLVADFEFCLWTLAAYLLFSVTYLVLVIRNVHKGAYKKIKEKINSPKMLALDAFGAAIMPISGCLGLIIARPLKAYGEITLQNAVLNICFLFMIIVPALGHVNFVKYYYCIKYKIFCDEKGNTLSPELM